MNWRRSHKCVVCKIPASIYPVSSIDYQDDWICTDCLIKLNPDEYIEVIQ